MTRVVVEAGVCGFTATVEVVRLSSRKVSVALASDCERVSQFGKNVREWDWHHVLRQPGNYLASESVFQCMQHHVSCPVPLAILKAIEVEVGAALPRDVVIRFENVGCK
jgi:hypothetical protein